MNEQNRIRLKTAAAMFVLLLFFSAQGAIVVITGIEGVPSAMISSIYHLVRCRNRDSSLVPYFHFFGPTDNQP